MSPRPFSRARAAALTTTAATLAAVAGSTLGVGPAGAVVRPTTPGFFFSDYTATGTETLKAVGKPSAVTAAIAGVVAAPSNSFSGTATSSPVTVSGKAYGFVPASATVQTVVAFTGPLSASVAPFAVASLSATAQLKATSIRIAGITAAGGTACQTAPAPVALAPATPPFAIDGSGTLAGTFTSGSLTGCGSFTSAIAGIVAGAGNSFSFDYAPAAS